MPVAMKTEKQVEIESEDNEYANFDDAFGWDVEMNKVKPLPLLTLD